MNRKESFYFVIGIALTAFLLAFVLNESTIWMSMAQISIVPTSTFTPTPSSSPTFTPTPVPPTFTPTPVPPTATNMPVPPTPTPTNSGSVTGGGWIDSPPGAYVPDPSPAGRANFGFIAKYEKGPSEPDGTTEFQFQAADLDFHSESYDWLVVAGPKAVFKGTGTINGRGSYGFLLSAIDAELAPSTDVDLFRIKIWDVDDDSVVYDNQVACSELDDAADPCTAIGGGSIVIHKGE